MRSRSLRALGGMLLLSVSLGACSDSTAPTETDPPAVEEPQGTGLLKITLALDSTAPVLTEGRITIRSVKDQSMLEIGTLTQRGPVFDFQVPIGEYMLDSARFVFANGDVYSVVGQGERVVIVKDAVASSPVSPRRATAAFSFRMNQIPAELPIRVRLVLNSSESREYTLNDEVRGLLPGEYEVQLESVKDADNNLWVPQTRVVRIRIDVNDNSVLIPTTYQLAGSRLTFAVSGLPESMKSGVRSLFSGTDGAARSRSGLGTAPVSQWESGTSSIWIDTVHFAGTKWVSDTARWKHYAGMDTSISVTAQWITSSIFLAHNLPSAVAHKFRFTASSGVLVPFPRPEIQNVPRGNTMVTIASVQDGDTKWAPMSSEMNVETSAAWDTLNVVFAPVPGSLKASFKGLPDGVAGIVRLQRLGSSTQGFMAGRTAFPTGPVLPLVTQFSVWSTLTPGAYWVHADSVKVGEKYYVPTVAAQKVSISSEHQTEVVINYVNVGGRISVTGVGLPAHLQPSFVLRNGRGETLSASVVEGGKLDPGTYEIEFLNVHDELDVYAPSEQRRTIVLEPLARVALQLEYAALPADLKIDLSGIPVLPSHTNIRVEAVQMRNGQPVSGTSRALFLTGASTRAQLPSGEWKVSWPLITTPVDEYEGATSTSIIEAAGGEITTVPAAYNRTTSHLTITFAGAPPHPDRHVQLSQPSSGQSWRIYSDTTLTGLKGGPLVYGMADFVKDGITYKASVGAGSVPISPGSTGGFMATYIPQVMTLSVSLQGIPQGRGSVHLLVGGSDIVISRDTALVVPQQPQVRWYARMVPEGAASGYVSSTDTTVFSPSYTSTNPIAVNYQLVGPAQLEFTDSLNYLGFGYTNSGYLRHTETNEVINLRPYHLIYTYSLRPGKWDWAFTENLVGRYGRVASPAAGQIVSDARTTPSIIFVPAFVQTRGSFSMSIFGVPPSLLAGVSGTLSKDGVSHSVGYNSDIDGLEPGEWLLSMPLSMPKLGGGTCPLMPLSPVIIRVGENTHTTVNYVCGGDP